MTFLKTTSLCGLVLLALSLPLAGCGDTASSGEEKVRLVLYSPPTAAGALDPFYDDVKGAMQFIELDIRGEGVIEGELSRLYHFPREGGVASIPDLPFNQRLQIIVKGYPASSGNSDVPSQYPLSVGRTGSFSVRQSDEVLEIPLLLSRVNAFAPLTVPSGTPGAEGTAVSMPAGRYGSTATVLQSGEILIAGGAILKEGTTNPLEDDAIAQVTSDVYRFDPDRGTLEQLSPMGLPRAFHTATLLPSGEVMIAGGISLDTLQPIPQVELFDPFGDRFKPGPQLGTARARHQASLLQPSSGQYLVLYTGGEGGADSWELIDPTSGSNPRISSGNLHTPRWNHRALYVKKGLKAQRDAVYIVGGENTEATVDTIEFFDAVMLEQIPPTLTLPRGGKTLPTVSFNEKRGFVFVAGGFTDRSKSLASSDVELFALDGSVEPLGLKEIHQDTHKLDLVVARGAHEAVKLSNEDVLFVGGMRNDEDGARVTVREGEVLTELVRIEETPAGQSMSITPIRTSVDNLLPLGVAFPATCVMESGNALILGGVANNAGHMESTPQAIIYAFDDTTKVVQ